MPISAPIRRGTVVYDVADPRRHGIVNSLHLRDGRFVAKVRWIDTGWKGHWVPVADLRRVTADTPSQPVRGRRLSKPECGSYDGHAVRYTYHDAWVLVDGEWRQIESVFAIIKAKRLTRQAYRETFGPLPPLPKIAFHDPPVRARPPSYGYDDGFAVRFTDDEAWACYADNRWRKISKTESLYSVGVLTKHDYHRQFGHRHLPPLPDTAFCSGWYSSLL